MTQGGPGHRIRTGALSALLVEIARGPAADDGWSRSLRPGAVVGRFELVREIGRGGFGVVWEAKDTELGRAVAFKALHAGSAGAAEERLLQEAEAAARLSHPNIVTLFDVGRTDGGLYLVLELLRGETLAKRLDQGPISVSQALRIAMEVAQALAHAHAHGVIHRDLTPGNVFLCDDGQVKVLDFGMAQAFGRRKLEGGTPAYMAPEQEEGAPEDERTDIFALGALLHRMLSGERVPVTSSRPVKRPVLGISGVPAVGHLVARMLAQRPTDRPRTADEVLSALAVFRNELERLAPGMEPRVSASRRTLPRWLAAAAACAIAVALVAVIVVRGTSPSRPVPEPAPSIAVLPFADLSPQHDQEYFSDGIAEEILSTLAQLENLRVSGRTSSFSFKGRSTDVAEIGRKLNVSAVLEGSVRRAGTRARITAQLVSTRDGFHLWSQTFDREMTDVFAVQEEIARSVMHALRVRLLAGREPAIREYRTTSPEAHESYLLGRKLFNEYTRDSLRRAEDAFEASLAADPGYAPPVAWLSLALSNSAGVSLVFDEARWERARVLAERAVASAPGLADAHRARSFVRLGALDWSGARTDIDHALAISPGDPDLHVRLGDLLATEGRIAEAITVTSKATSLDPLNPWAWHYLACYYAANGSYPLAHQAADRALEASPHHILALRDKAFTHLLEGKAAVALELFEQHPTEYIRLTGIALAQHTLGHSEASRRALEQLRALSPTSEYQIAQICSWRGESNCAFEALDKALSYRDVALRYLKYDPFVRNLRTDARYAALLRKMNLPLE